jgi:hypothetical protein
MLDMQLCYKFGKINVLTLAGAEYIAEISEIPKAKQRCKEFVMKLKESNDLLIAHNQRLKRSAHARAERKRKQIEDDAEDEPEPEVKRKKARFAKAADKDNGDLELAFTESTKEKAQYADLKQESGGLQVFPQTRREYMQWILSLNNPEANSRFLQLIQKDVEIKQKDAEIKQRDAEIKQKDAESDIEIKKKQADSQIEIKQKQVDAEIKNSESVVRDRDSVVRDRNSVSDQRDVTTAKMRLELEAERSQKKLDKSMTHHNQIAEQVKRYLSASGPDLIAIEGILVDLHMELGHLKGRPSATRYVRALLKKQMASLPTAVAGTPICICDSSCEWVLTPLKERV